LLVIKLLKMNLLLALLTCFWLGFTPEASAQAPKAAPRAAAEGKVTLDFKDIELTDLIQTVSELTGKLYWKACQLDHVCLCSCVFSHFLQVLAVRQQDYCHS
jgi:hypothetical protein